MARRRRSPGARSPGGDRPHPAAAAAGTTRGRPGVRAEPSSCVELADPAGDRVRVGPGRDAAGDVGQRLAGTDDRDRGAGRGGSSGPGERHHEPDEHAEQHPQHDTEDRDGDDPPASQHRRGDRRLDRTRGTGGRGPATGDPRAGGRQHRRAAPTGRTHRPPGVLGARRAASPRAAGAPRTARRARRALQPPSPDPTPRRRNGPAHRWSPRTCRPPRLAHAFDRTRVRCLASTPDNVDGSPGVSFEHVFDPVGPRR